MKKSFVFMFLTVLIIFLCGNVYAQSDESLIAYYPFNGKAIDLSGNNNDGTEHGDVRYVTGKNKQ